MITGKSPRIAETGSAVSIRNPVNDMARDILGWEPKVSLKTGLEELYRYLESLGV